MKYYRELWLKGPVRNEARRLAREELRKHYARKGEDFDLCSEVAIEKAITVLIFNSEDIYLKKAKWNLENRGS
jgi:hypothetical protein